MKDKFEKTETKICPVCGQAYTAVSALSREDGQTLICPDCGIRQALESIGIKADEREKILHIIHSCTKE